MVSSDISLTPSLPGATLSLSLSLNKRILDDFMGLCFFGRIRSKRKEGVTRITESTHGRLPCLAPPRDHRPGVQRPPLVLVWQGKSGELARGHTDTLMATSCLTPNTGGRAFFS